MIISKRMMKAFLKFVLDWNEDKNNWQDDVFELDELGEDWERIGDILDKIENGEDMTMDDYNWLEELPKELFPKEFQRY